MCIIGHFNWQLHHMISVTWHIFYVRKNVSMTQQWNNWTNSITFLLLKPPLYKLFLLKIIFPNILLEIFVILIANIFLTLPLYHIKDYIYWGLIYEVKWVCGYRDLKSPIHIEILYMYWNIGNNKTGHNAWLLFLVHGLHAVNSS